MRNMIPALTLGSALPLSTKAKLIASALLATTGMVSHATVIYEVDFSTSNADYSQPNLFNFVAAPTTPTSSQATVAGELVSTYNVAGTDPEYGSGSGVMGVFILKGGRVNDATDDVLANYQLSFDARAVGLVDPGTPLDMILDFKFTDSTGTGIVDTRKNITITSSNQTYTFALDTLPVLAGAWSATPSAVINANTLSLELHTGNNDRFGADTAFGFDDGNQIIIDNVVLQAIPEPGTMTLLATTGLLMLRRRAH